MSLSRTLCCSRRAAKPSRQARGALAVVCFAGLLGVARPAAAVDGCLVLLCFAAPSWRAIPECVPPVRQVLHDLAKGKAFPTCPMAGEGNPNRCRRSDSARIVRAAFHSHINTSCARCFLAWPAGVR